MGTGDCGEIVKHDEDNVKLSTYEVNNGTLVEVACRLFANRLVEGSRMMVCDNGKWKPDVVPKCEYSGELNSYEKIVIGVSVAAAVLLVFVLILIAACGLRFRLRLRQQKQDKNADGCSTSTVSLHKRNGSTRDQESRQSVNSGQYQQQIRHVDESMHGGPYTKKSDGYVYYSGTSGEDQYFDNKAYEPKSLEKSDDFADPIKYGSRPFSYIKDEKYKWDGHLPRPTLNRDGHQ